MDEMKKQSENDNVWINHYDLDRKQNLDMKNALFGESMLFDRLSIDKGKINKVQQFEWKIDEDKFEKCLELGESECTRSPHFVYNIGSDRVIRFHFNFYARMSFDDEEHCGIFVEIENMPEDMKRFNIDVDIKCNEKKAYRQLMRDQELTQKKRMCGLRIFKTSTLQSNSSLEWTFGVKIFNLKMIEMDEDHLYREISDL